MLVSVGRRLHTYDGPSESLKTKMAELEKMRKSNIKSTKKQKQQVFVEVPEPLTYLDTATMPMYLAAAGIALFAKLLMMVKLAPMSLIISATPFVNLPSTLCVFVTLLGRICFSLESNAVHSCHFCNEFARLSHYYIGILPIDAACVLQ